MTVNPWTSEGNLPKAETPERQQQIEATLRGLADILQVSLEVSPRAQPAASEAPAILPTPVAEAEKSETLIGDTVSGEVKDAPTKPIIEAPVLGKSFPARPKSEVKETLKPLPRGLSGAPSAPLPVAEAIPSKPEAEAASERPREITAPTTLMGPSAPVSPFTKVVKAAAPVGEIAQPNLEKAPPSQDEGAPSSKPATPFASPFATALEKKKRQAGGDQAGPVSKSPVRPVAAPPARSHPTGESPQVGGEDETLPPPAYSFASVGLPSGQAKSKSSSIPAPKSPPKGPGLSPVGQGLPPARGLPSTRAASPVSTPLQTAEVGAQTQGERVRKRRRVAERPLPESGSWGFLTWIFGFVSVVFLLIYVFEIYEKLTESPAGYANPSETLTSSEGAGSGVEGVPAFPEVDLSEPLECVSQYLALKSAEARLPYLLEREGEGILARLDRYYKMAPLSSGRATQIIDSGTYQDTGRQYVMAQVAWESGATTNVPLIKDREGDYRFSWMLFEQRRRQLLRLYAETAWSDWNQFFVEIRPVAPETLPEGIILENLYYRVTVPEDPGFEAIAYVDENSSMVSEFRDRFARERVYEVLVDLQRDVKLLDDDRPVFRLTRLRNASWDPAL